MVGGDRRLSALGRRFVAPATDSLGPISIHTSGPVRPAGRVLAFVQRSTPSPGAERAMAAVLKMQKLDIAAIRAAYEGKS